MWSPSARVMANLCHRCHDQRWKTQEVPARYMPFTRSLMMCPPAEIVAVPMIFKRTRDGEIMEKKRHFQCRGRVRASLYAVFASMTVWPQTTQNFRLPRLGVPVSQNTLTSCCESNFQSTASWTIPCLQFINLPRLHLHRCWIPNYPLVN